MRLRLSTFCTVIGEDRAAFRALLARGTAPFSPHPPDGQGQRSYAASDLLAWMLFDRLRRIGMAHEDAAETVRLARAADDFLAAPEADRAQLHLITAREAIRRTVPLADVIQMHHAFVGTPQDVADLLMDRAATYGAPALYATEPRDTGRTRLGIASLVAIPIRPAFEDARSRLAPLRLDFAGLDLVETPR